MLDRVRRTIRDRRLLRPGEHVVLAVSGGGDSVALAVVMSELRRELQISASVACVDHGLRAESTDEVAFVAALARSLDLPLDSDRLDLERGANLQARARHARYAALHAIAERRGGSAIATGHTLDDQAETVLVRALGGAGLEGLSAIRPARGDGVIRPLIDCRRSELRDFLRDRGVEWLEDPSNADPSFERVKARRALVGLAEHWPAANVHLAQLADDAAAARQVLRSRSRAWLARARGPKGLRIRALRAASRGVRAAVLRRWVRDETHRPLSRVQARAVEQVVRTGRGDVLLGSDWGVTVRGAWLVLERRKRRTRSTRTLR